MHIGFVHTVPALASSFERALLDREPGATATHVVDAELLARARRSGVDELAVARLAAHVEHLRHSGADAVLVTCSTLGDATERAAVGEGAPLVRVDSAMAEQAVALVDDLAAATPRLAVLATETATIGPTTAILQRTAAAQGCELEIEVRVLDEALAARQGGDQGRHDALIVEAVRTAAATAHVVVLAQASMAPAADEADVGVPVLTSTTSALERVITVARAAR